MPSIQKLFAGQLFPQAPQLPVSYRRLVHEPEHSTRGDIHEASESIEASKTCFGVTITGEVLEQPVPKRAAERTSSADVE